MIETAALLLLTLQAAGDKVVAIKPENPQTWTIEYPAAIEPQVKAYYGCLNSNVKRITGKANFESQHREDITICRERREMVQTESIEIVAALKREDKPTPEQVVAVFDRLEQIHVERGRDIDQQFLIRIQSAQTQIPEISQETEQNSHAQG